MITTCGGSFFLEGPLLLVSVRNYQPTDDSDSRRHTGLDELWLVVTESERPENFPVSRLPVGLTVTPCLWGRKISG